MQRVVGWDIGTSLFVPKEIDGLRLPPGKASTEMTDHLLTRKSGSSRIIHTYIHTYALVAELGGYI